MKGELNVEYNGKDKMFLHQEIGKGKLPDGRECRLLQTNAGIHMQVTDKDGKGWDTFSVSYMNLSKAFSDVILMMEAEIQNKVER